MAATPPAQNVAPGRGRRAARMNGDERERAILQSAERLLEERPLHELSIDDLARGAGISRSSFYFYFPSKEAVLLSLMDGVIREADERRDAALMAVGSESPQGLCRAGITAFYDTFREHRAVALAAADARASLPEARALWARVMDGWVDLVAGLIEAERARGVVSASGVPARDLSIALNLMNERVLEATFAGDTPAIDEAAVVDALVSVWLGAIYGAPDPAAPGA